LLYKNLYSKIYIQQIYISHPHYHKKNLEAIKILLENNYAPLFIFSNICTRLKYSSYKPDLYEHINSSINIKNKFFTVPYVKIIFENFVLISQKSSKKNSIPNTLKRFMKQGWIRSKDALWHGLWDNLLQLRCILYWPTKRQGTRDKICKVKEHISDINKKNRSSSVVSNREITTMNLTRMTLKSWIMRHHI